MAQQRAGTRELRMIPPHGRIAGYEVCYVYPLLMQAQVEAAHQRNALSNCGTSARNAVFLLLWVAGVFAIITGSLLPGTTVSLLETASMHFNDKALHFCGYLLVATLPNFALKRRSVALACALGLIPMGICLEFLQRLVPGRSFELVDMAANTAGVLTGLAVAHFWRRFYGRAAIV